MNSGDTVGVYITYTSVLAVAYTNGTTLGNIYVQKSSIEVHEGYGKSYPFGSSFQPRVFNGIVNFCLGSSTSIAAHTLPKSALLFPNPMNINATLKISEDLNLDGLQLIISNVNGDVVKKQNVSDRETIINRDNLSNGMYFYSLIRNNKSIANGKIVLQ
jgi:hypothetical protein